MSGYLSINDSGWFAHGGPAPFDGTGPPKSVCSLEIEESMVYPLPMERDYVLYLKVGDEVFHKRCAKWGMGVVVEERRSEVPGGFCYVRINFGDGNTRVFDNNFKSEGCCYYAGIRKIDRKK